MNLIARTILYYRCNHTRILLRLFKRTHYTAWTPNTFQRFREDYRYFLPCCTYQTVANSESQLYNFSEIDLYVPEHKHVHLMLQNSNHYKSSILLPISRIQQVSSEDLKDLYATDWSSQNTEQIFNAIKKLAYCHLNGSHFETSLYDKILQATISNFSKFNDHTIKLIMQCLITLADETNKTKAHKNLLKALNQECITRFFRIDINEMLLICDAFYQLRDYNCNYLWRAMRKLCSKVHKLTGKNLVQILFLLNLCKPNSFVNMFEIECQLMECLHELSGNEIGIIARGFFLNKRRVKSRTLMPKMMERVLESVDTMNTITLSSFMKLIRYTEPIHSAPIFENLLESLHPKIPHLSLKCLTHTMHACATMRVYHKVLVDKILERIVNEVKFIRLKDIERIIHAVSIITPFTKYYADICHEITNEIMSTYRTDRAIEIEKFAITLTRIAMHLAIKDIYVPELIQHIFDPAFVQKMYNNNLRLLTSDLLYLHCCVKIDMPDYEGPFYKESIYQYLVKKYSFNDDVFRKDNNIKIRAEIVFLCKNNLGIDPYVDYILPNHSQRYIILGLDENGKCIDVEPILSKMPLGTIKYVNSDEMKKIKWKILFIIPTLARIQGHNSIHGNMRKNIKHLITIGYTPLLVLSKNYLL
ncbi:FAST kinase domain-containing protein 5, mitochondrial [Anthophora plagiata]